MQDARQVCILVRQNGLQHRTDPAAGDCRPSRPRRHAGSRTQLRWPACLCQTNVEANADGFFKHVGYAELASAVSNAGGLGIITALIFPEPEGLRHEIRRCRQMTSKPFGVNITMLPALVPPDYDAYAQVVVDESVNVVETAGNSPGPVIAKLKAAGVTVLHKCTSIRHAQSAVKLGVDFLSIDGFECAGYDSP
jgi:hypothetical protein